MIFKKHNKMIIINIKKQNFKIKLSKKYKIIAKKNKTNFNKKNINNFKIYKMLIKI